MIELSQPHGRKYSVRADLVIGIGTADTHAVQRASDEGMYVLLDTTIVYLADLTIFNVQESVQEVTKAVNAALVGHESNNQPGTAEADVLLDRNQDAGPGVHLKVEGPSGSRERLHERWTRWRVESRPPGGESWGHWSTNTYLDQAEHEMNLRAGQYAHTEFRIVEVETRVVGYKKVEENR